MTAGGTVLVTAVNSGLLKFKAAADENGSSYDAFSFRVGDDGGTANGGVAIDPTANVITFDVGAVNDTPVVDGPGSAYTVNEQTNLSIEGTGFTVADVDAASGTMTATLNVGEGAITIVEGDSGVTITGGNGSGTVTLTGTLTQIDNLLTGASTGTITYFNGK